MKTRTNKIVFPTAIWGLSQLALLAIGASGFPMWGHHPLPRESVAIQELVCGQMIFIAMLFPTLGGSSWSLTTNIALMLPFDELAGLLSNVPQITILKYAVFVALWMLGLVSWRLQFSDNRLYQIVVSIAVLYVIGGALFDYLAWGEHLASGSSTPISYSGLLTQLCQPSALSGLKVWLEAAAPLLIFVAVSVPSTLLHNLRKSPSTSLHTTH